MNSEIQRNLGEQPIVRIMRDHNLDPHALVAASTEQITHKMVSRACRGRRLTSRVQLKIISALSRAAGREYTREDLFTY